MLEINHRKYRRCDVIKLAGRIDSATAPQFQEALNAITEAGRYNIVLNLSKVDFLSSAGLRHLITTKQTCKKYNRGKVVLTEVPDKIKETLDLAGVAVLFPFFDTEVDSVASF